MVATPENLPDGCVVGTIETIDVVIGISLKNSSVRISHSRFERNKVGLGAVIYGEFSSDIIIFNTTFINNNATGYCTDYCCFAGGIVYVSKSQGSNVKVLYSKFDNRYQFSHCFIVAISIRSHGDKNDVYTSTASIIHSEFANNTVAGPRKIISNRGASLIFLDAVMKTISLSKFFRNRASFAIVYVPYSHYTATENFSMTKNVFYDNSAGFEVYVAPHCPPGLNISLSSTHTRCIKCSANWHRDLIGIVLAAFIAGIALVIFTLALNMTVAIGTLNGILFYAHIVAANADTYTFCLSRLQILSQYSYHGLILILALMYASILPSKLK